MFKKILSLTILIIVLSSCSGAVKNREISVKIRQNIKNNEYDQALENAKSKNYYTQENSKLLKNLEIGTIHYMRGEYYQALKYFEKAKKISDDLYTISVSRKLSGAWDANLDNYYGERYERSMIRFYLSLINYDIYKQGFYEEYKDENNNIIPKKELNNSEKNFHLNYARSSIIEWDTLLKSMQNESVGKSIYKNDMMAKLWGAYIHSEFNSSGDRQIALQLYRDADELLLRNYNMYPIFNRKSEKFNRDFNSLPYKTYSELYENYIDETNYARDLKQYINENLINLENNQENNLIVLLKDDLISPKEVDTVKIPLPMTSDPTLYSYARSVMTIANGVPVIPIEFPKIKRVETIQRYILKAYNENDEEIASTTLALIEPLSDIAKKTLDDEIALIRTAIITRIAAKYVVALAGAYAIHKQGGDFSDIIALATFAASVATINETSRADIRYWSTLFSDIQMGGLKLPNGKYKIKIQSNDKIFYDEIVEIDNNKKFIDLNVSSMNSKKYINTGKPTTTSSDVMNSKPSTITTIPTTTTNKSITPTINTTIPTQNNNYNNNSNNQDTSSRNIKAKRVRTIR